MPSPLAGGRRDPQRGGAVPGGVPGGQPASDRFTPCLGPVTGGKGVIVAPALESCRGASSHHRWETGQTRVWLDFQASQVPCSAAPLPPGGPAWHVWLAFCVPRAGFQSPVSGGGTAARPPGLGTVSSVLGWERDGQMDAGAGYKTLPILHHTQLPPDSCTQGPQSPPVARQSSCPSPTGAGGREGLDSGLLPALAKDAT